MILKNSANNFFSIIDKEKLIKNINRFNEIKNKEFSSISKIEFQIFKSDLLHYLKKNKIDYNINFISFKDFRKILINSGHITIIKEDRLKDFKHTYLLNTVFPFKSDSPLGAINLDMGSSYKFTDSKQVYLALLDRNYKNIWSLATMLDNSATKRSDVRYRRSNYIMRDLYSIDFYLLSRVSPKYNRLFPGSKGLMLYPLKSTVDELFEIDNIGVNKRIKLEPEIEVLNPTDLILVSVNNGNSCLLISYTPFGILIWDLLDSNLNSQFKESNLLNIIKSYEY